MLIYLQCEKILCVIYIFVFLTKVIDVEKNIISIAHVDISAESLLSALHIDTKDDDLVESVMTIYREAVKIAKPVAIYSCLTPELRGEEIWLNNIAFKEPFVYKMLSECDIVVPYVASCGREIDLWSKSFADIFEQFTADTLKQMCLGAIREKLFSEVKQKYFDSEKNISTLNPGSLKEWAITGQIPLFELLGGVTDDIGVELSKSLLMSPTKSISGIMFQSEESFENCQLCPKINCPGRRVPYAGD